MPFKVAVCGSGLTGLTFANCLLKHASSDHDLELRLFTATANKHQHRSAGWQVSIGEMGFSSLQRALPAKVYAAVERDRDLNKSYSQTFLVRHTDYGNKEGFMPDPDGERKTPMNRPLLRDQLYETLGAYSSDIIQHNKRYSSFRILEDNSVELRFIDSITYFPDLVIDATGAESHIIDDLGLENQDTEKKIIIVGGGPMPTGLDRLHGDLSGGGFPKESIDDGAIFATDESGATGFFLVSERTSFAIHDTGYYVFLFPLASIPELWRFWEGGDTYEPTSEEWKGFVIDYMREHNWGPLVMPIVETTPFGDTQATLETAARRLGPYWRKSLQDVARAGAGGDKRPGHERIWLLGNAAHTMPRSLGENMDHALADAITAAEEALKLSLGVRGRTAAHVERRILEACLRYELASWPQAFDALEASMQNLEITTEYMSRRTEDVLSETMVGSPEASQVEPSGDEACEDAGVLEDIAMESMDVGQEQAEDGAPPIVKGADEHRGDGWHEDEESETEYGVLPTRCLRLWDDGDLYSTLRTHSIGLHQE